MATSYIPNYGQAFSSRRYSVPSNTARNFVFSSGVKNGLILISAQGKYGMYFYSSTSSSAVTVNEVHKYAGSTTGFTISASGQIITIDNAVNAAYVMVLAYYGDLPTMETP